MLVDYENDKYEQDSYAHQTKSRLGVPPIYKSDKFDLEEIIEAVTLRLYRCDIAHAWNANGKVYVDAKMPQIGINHPLGMHGGITIEPGMMVGNGRQDYIKYLVKMHIIYDHDTILANFADDLLFDLYRYGKCDMEDIERAWLDRYGREFMTYARVVKASEMPDNGRLKWAKSIIVDLLKPNREKLEELKRKSKKSN